MRRPNGTGTIVKLSGNRRNPYAVRIAYRDAYNFVAQRALSYHPTAKAAQEALDDYNAKKALSASPAADKLNVTLREVYELWSARKYPKSGASSVGGYRASWKRLSVLGEEKVRTLSIDILQHITDQGAAKGLSKSALTKDKLLMRALFRFAMERDIVAKDYSEYVELPDIDEKYEKGSLTDLQMKQLERMAADGFPWADTVLMLCYTGFRITEFLTVTRFAYHGNYLQWGIKTQAGKDRIVPIHPKIKPYLDKWLALGGDTIICNEDGRPIGPEIYREKMFKPIATSLGLPQATPHWCRHTYATRLHAVGVDELTRKLLLGHSTSKNVTNIYTHPSNDILINAVLKMA